MRAGSSTMTTFSRPRVLARILPSWAASFQASMRSGCWTRRGVTLWAG